MNGVIELRQYTLKPGRRDELIALFEREFIESQEAEGMDIIGTFRDLDDPNRFVWLRGFPDMEARAKSLAAFYGGPAWKAHRNAANDAMIDSDNVLLLKPAWNGSGFPSGGTRAPVGATGSLEGIVIATICYFRVPIAEPALHAICAASGKGDHAFVTETSANTFPALPVREGENVLVWFSGQPCPQSLAQSAAKQEVLRLQPTARSKLRG
jgi:quinol monooxygenase YgiN